MGRIKLEWRNSCDIGDKLYQTGYTNVLYFDTIIGIPKTTHQTEGIENGDGAITTTFQRRTKAYEMTVLIPEYVLDALQDVRLHDTIKITSIEPYRVYEVTDKTTFQVDSNFEFDSQCMATAIISFEADEVLIKSGCCTKFDLPSCYYDTQISTIGCGSSLPINAKIGQYYLLGGPSASYPGYYDFVLYQYLAYAPGWAVAAQQPNNGDYICCMSSDNPGECDAIYMFETIPDPFPTSNGQGQTVNVYSLIPSIIELVTSTVDGTGNIKIRAPRGSWNTLMISGNCTDYTTINTTEVSDDELYLNGIDFVLPVACGEYCIKLVSRKTGCVSLDYDFTLFAIPDNYSIWNYVDRVYLANACPIPFWQPFGSQQVYLILPESPCTNDPAICSHLNELILRSPVAGHALIYLTPSVCDVVQELATGDKYLWTGSEWQQF